MHVKCTNIVIDDFQFHIRNQRFQSLVYILSHMHSDHYKGLDNSFNNGPILCTKITGKLLELKFPSLKDFITTHEYNQPFKIKYPNSDLSVTVVFFDANHIMGSAMILLIGHFGTILYSGDLRFGPPVIKNNPQLFYQKGQIQYQIDELVLDNTFCDPLFQFPAQQECIDIIEDIIQQQLNKGKKRFIIYCYNIGKEEICVSLSKIFKTKVGVSFERYAIINAVNYYPNNFTCNLKEGFIEMRSGVNEFQKYDNDQSVVHIKITGWINCKQFLKVSENEFLVAYSSHSNFQELQDFVSLVKPGILSKVNIERTEQLSLNEVSNLNSYFVYLKNMKQTGMNILETLVDKTKISKAYSLTESQEEQNKYLRVIQIRFDQDKINENIFNDQNKRFIQNRQEDDQEQKINFKFKRKISKINQQYFIMSNQYIYLDLKNNEIALGWLVFKLFNNMADYTKDFFISLLNNEIQIASLEMGNVFIGYKEGSVSNLSKEKKLIGKVNVSDIEIDLESVYFPSEEQVYVKENNYTICLIINEFSQVTTDFVINRNIQQDPSLFQIGTYVQQSQLLESIFQKNIQDIQIFNCGLVDDPFKVIRNDFLSKENVQRIRDINQYGRLSFQENKQQDKSEQNNQILTQEVTEEALKEMRLWLEKLVSQLIIEYDIENIQQEEEFVQERERSISEIDEQEFYKYQQQQEESDEQDNQHGQNRYNTEYAFQKISKKIQTNNIHKIKSLSQEERMNLLRKQIQQKIAKKNRKKLQGYTKTNQQEICVNDSQRRFNKKIN